MDLILWRHAEAIELPEEGNDMDRNLTPKGERQAVRMSAWLDRVLPQGTRIFSSPATRCEQTVLALGRRYKLREELSPNGHPDEVLALTQWPLAKSAVLVVGHQPYLGQVVAKISFLEVSGFSSTSMPAARSKGMVSSKIRPLDKANVIISLFQCPHRALSVWSPSSRTLCPSGRCAAHGFGHWPPSQP